LVHQRGAAPILDEPDLAGIVCTGGRARTMGATAQVVVAPSHTVVY
jgi:hypothetical protein